jgi:alpha-glucuronidase
MWEEYLAFDTLHAGPGSTIVKLLTTGFDNTTTVKPVREGNTRNSSNALGHDAGKMLAKEPPGAQRRLSGMACVSNLGTFSNWTGHVLAGSNTYGFGRRVTGNPQHRLIENGLN